MADYVGVDGAGKLNIIGGGFTMMGLEPSGATPPFAVAVTVEAPAKYVGQEFALSIELRDETTGTVVTMAGPSGQPEALRVQQVAKFDRALPPPGFYVPGELPTRFQVNLGFSNGLPLRQSASYAWRVELDTQHRKAWVARFCVPGPPPGPVFGGPTGPAGIPTLPSN